MVGIGQGLAVEYGLIQEKKNSRTVPAYKCEGNIKRIFTLYRFSLTMKS